MEKKINIQTNDVNSGHAASSGSGLSVSRSIRTDYPPTGQVTYGRHQETVPPPLQHQPENTSQEEVGVTPVNRRKWNKNDNKEIWKCYIKSNPNQRGYRSRMKNIWDERNNYPQTEQRLADQIRLIKKNNWLSRIEREELQREIEGQIEEVQQQQQPQPTGNEFSNEDQPTLEEPESQNNEEQPIPPEYLEKISNWMNDDTEKWRIPSLKSCNHKKLKEKTKEVEEILGHIHTSSITETNNLLYAGARLVVELMDVQIRPRKSREQVPNKPEWKRNQPPWKRRLEKQISDMRADLSKLKEIADDKLRNKNKKKELYARYNVLEKGLNTIMEDLKQRIKAKSYKIQRYSNRNKGYQQNKLFQTNQRQLYSQLKGENRQQDVPEAEPSKRLWEGIWANPVAHNKHAEWLREIKAEENQRERQIFSEITTATVRAQVKKIPNWKAPGPDGVNGYWIKNFKILHERIAKQLQQCITNHQAPLWMTTGRTSLIQKDKNKGIVPSNYRPITCLPIMWKLLTGIISERLYNYLEDTNTLPFQQKGGRRKCRGTKDQLLIDKMVMKNCKRRKTNLSMAWVDYKKAFDMVPHSWLIECLEIYGAAVDTIRFLKNTMANWKTILTSSGVTLAEVNIRRGIFQGDSLSPLLFVIAMIPMTRVLEKMREGYQLEKGNNRINHLMFMDDIKLYGKNSKEIDTLIQTVRIVSSDIGMEFGIDKCAVINIQRGKVAKTEGIPLPDGRNIKVVDDEGYKYLGVIEADGIKHEDMKDNIKEEYIKRVKAVLKSGLNSGNLVTAINTWAVPVVRYSAGIVEWTKLELDNMDRKTRKIMNMHKALHPRSNVDRLYIPRKEGGKGLLSIKDTVYTEIRALGQYLKTSEDQWLAKAWEENLIKEDEDPETYKDRIRQKRKEDWRRKVMHGQFTRQTEDISSNDSWQWLQRGELKKETEGMLMAAQDQALRTRYVQRTIDGINISAKCRKCNVKDETINHIVSECSALAQNQYKKRHDAVAKTLHWSLCRKFKIECSSNWYEHQPIAVIENEQAKLLWDFSIRTDRVIQAHRPDITLVDKCKNKVSLIDVAVPWDSRVEDKEREKKEKYQDLRLELRRLWDMPVEIVPIVIGALGTIPKALRRNMDELEAEVPPGLMQKSVLLETAHIIRRVMDS